MDMHNAGKHHLSKSGLDLIKRMIQIDQRNYPETLHKLFIVNTPWILHASYAVVARWMDPVTASKIQVLGSVHDESVRTALLEVVREEDLPTFLGGRRCCGLEVAGCRVHPLLRRGELPIDDEAGAQIAAGGTSVRSVIMTRVDAAAAAAATARMDEGATPPPQGAVHLVVRGHGGNVRIDATWRSGGEVLSARSANLDAGGMAELLTLHAPPNLDDNGAQLRLSFSSDNYYRACTVFWSVTGIAPDAWVAEG